MALEKKCPCCKTTENIYGTNTVVDKMGSEKSKIGYVNGRMKKGQQYE
jgi:phage FluMu protein Com